MFSAFLSDTVAAATEPAAMNSIGFQNFTGDLWSIIGIGYLGIFIVTIVIILIVSLLNKFGSKK